MTPGERQVHEDASREDGTWSPGAVAWRHELRIAYATAAADAYADANTNANTNANANADADANTNANADADADADADAYADAYATAAADADANAYAYAYAYANADADANAIRNPNPSTGGEHVRNGLFLFTSPSGNLTVVRIGWIRRVAGDEYECLSMVTPLRQGDYFTMWADAAIDGPPKKWKFTRALTRPSPLNRFHILGPVSLDPKQWADVSPRPNDWAE